MTPTVFAFSPSIPNANACSYCSSMRAAASAFISPGKMAFICFTPKSPMKKENEKPRGTEEGVTFPSITFVTGWKRGAENAKLYHQALHSTVLRPGFSVLSRSDSEIEDVEKAPRSPSLSSLFVLPSPRS